MCPLPASPLSFLAAAAEVADAPALVTASFVLTFGELAPSVRRAAAWLAAKGADDRGVALVPTLRAETVVALWALIELGVPAVMVHPRLNERERQELVRTSGAGLLLDEAWTIPDADAAPAFVPPEAAREDAPLAILFTSGTAGSPKGVLLSRRAFLAAASASAENLGWEPDDRWLLCMPLAHVGGLSVVVRCLVARKAIVLSPWTGSLEALLDDVSACRASLLSLVPTMLRRILDESPDYRFPAHVRAVLLGGDAASGTLLADAARRGVPALTTYGLTEACSQVATQAPGSAPSLDAGVGPPLRGVEVRIVGGEIQVRGPNLMTGYHPSDRWPSPFLEGGWLPTGDLGELDAEGRLHVRGRRSDLIITGGENVDPREVEGVLREHAGVADACVFGVADERWGQIVAAALIPADPLAPPELVDVARHAAERLAKYKRPRAYAIAASLVLNATSKLDRKKTASAVLESLVALVALEGRARGE